MKVLRLLLLCVVSSIVSMAGQPASVRQVDAVRLTSSVRMDGILSEDIWKTAPAATVFLQRDPVEGAAPSERTEVRIVYDDDAVYVGARMFDAHPDSIVSQLERKDYDTHSDYFLLFLDPYHDKRTGYYFGINAGGTLYDGTLFNDDWDNNSWDGIWEGKVHIDSEGWTAELRIPFSQLRFFDTPDHVWGVNYCRRVERRHEQDYLAFTPKKESGFVSRFPELHGITDIHNPRRLEVYPYVTTKGEFLKHDPGDPFRGSAKYSPNMGGDLKLGFSSNLTLDATINPDFGQVEVDPAVVNLSDGETYFNEKRPFFLEGANIFDFGSGGANNNWNFTFSSPTLFYTRRIGRAPQGSTPDDVSFEERPAGTRILGAAKLTGNAGRDWNIGTIHAVTQKEYARIDMSGAHSEYAVEPLTYYGIVRARKELRNNTASIGVMGMLTERQLSDPVLKDQFNSGAAIGGMDAWTFIGKDNEWALTGAAATSNVAGSKQRMVDLQRSSVHYFQREGVDHLGVDSNAASISGYAGRFALNKQKGNILFNAALTFVSPGFEANDLGFQSKADFVNYHILTGYKWTEPGAVFRFAEIDAAVYRAYDFGKNPIGNGYFTYGAVTFNNYSWFNGWMAFNPSASMSKDATRGGPMVVRPRWTEFNMNVGTDYQKSLAGAIHCYGLTMSPSWTLNWDAELQWRPASNISVVIGPSIGHSREDMQWIDNVDDPSATGTYGRRFIFAELEQRTISANVRVNWTFTPQLSLQLFMQPLISHNTFTRYKELARPESYAFRVYGDDGSTWDPGTFTADPDGPGPAAPIEIGDKDFTYKGLRGNLVLRWEYHPGSIVYVVWTQSRNDDEKMAGFDIGASTRRLVNLRADNIVLVKWSHYLSL
ncbi:MAG: DUF5916 domain-containing protein [Acidobacteriota bacterium]